MYELIRGAHERVDYTVLKTISEFVAGYEVADQPFWAWEDAVLQGFTMFRELKKRRRGRVIVSLTDRRLHFEELTS